MDKKRGLVRNIVVLIMVFSMMISIKPMYAWADSEDNSTNIEELGLNKDNLLIKLGRNYNFQVLWEPHTDEDVYISWSSSNNEVAAVDKDGKMYTKKCGNTIITAREPITGLTASCTVEVYEDLAIKAPAMGQIVARKDLGVHWTESSSFDSYIITLRNLTKEYDVIKDMSIEGNSYIIDEDKLQFGCRYNISVKSVNAAPQDKWPEKSITFTVEDDEKVRNIKISNRNLEMKIGDTYIPRVLTTPMNVAYVNLQWSSSDEKVAKVNQEGEISALGEGRCRITVLEKKSGRSERITLRVVDEKVEEIKPELPDVKGKTVPVEDLRITWGNCSPSGKYLLSVKNVTKEEYIMEKEKVEDTEYVLKKDMLEKGDRYRIYLGVITEYENEVWAERSLLFTTGEVIDRVALKNIDISLSLGDVYNLETLPFPEDTEKTYLVWKSSRENVVRVDRQGKIYTVGEGESIITVKESYSGEEAQCRIKVGERGMKEIYITSPENNSIFDQSPINIKWEEDRKAHGYMITIEDETAGKFLASKEELRRNRYTIKKDELIQGHSYRVSVASVDENGVEYWAVEPVQFKIRKDETKSIVISNIKDGDILPFEDKIIKWGKIPDTKKYSVTITNKITGEVVLEKTTEYYYINFYQEQMIKGGKYTVQIKTTDKNHKKWEGKRDFEVEQG